MAPIKVFASRDFKHYRSVQSPVAQIAERYYGFIAGDTPQASHARLAYATAYLGHEPSLNGPFAGSELDRAVQTILSSPPDIVLAQGPMNPWGLFTASAESERMSMRSGTTTSSGTVVEPLNAIFLPWQVHQAHKEGTDNDEPEEVAYASFFMFACVVHETAHWIAAQRRERHATTRDAALTGNMPLLDFEKSKITTHSRRDWGTHAKELLLGFAFTFISYADGSHEVVCQRVLPAISKLKPAIQLDVQAAVIGCKMPRLVDVSQYGPPAPREAPRWRKSSDFLIVSAISPDVSCHHGACRIRPGM
ncbi:hypothetical protein BKA62DRAFT_707919 [Auriculariales sp. MPI-PUGE-AT-0066]|nr:hypothetical protein BKA62DRAFT_707919 [Auriculariales sp. MPI-PUGE-AT-0066]